MTTLNGNAPVVTDWATRAADLADELIATGKLTSPVWRAAVQAVPRHVFVPSFYVRRDGGMVAIDATNAEWIERVYANAALVTKIDQDGPGPPVFLSSSSTPGLMTRMLEALDVGDGQKVLEIGTGTGYNALLAVDRAPTAVRATGAKLRGSDHVTVAHAVLPAQLPDRTFDLVVASEILYYFTAGDLGRLLDGLISRLRPGGEFVAAHWRASDKSYGYDGFNVHDQLGQRSELDTVVHHEDENFVLDILRRRPGIRT